MHELLSKLLTISLVIFMAGNLLEMGLKLKMDEAFKALRDVRFFVLTLVWSFVLGPAIAVLLTKILPLAAPYALGLLILGMAPCAPYLPFLSEKARGDLGYVAAFMLLTAVGTVALMPLMVPVLCKGFAADPWAIGKPLLFFIAIPLAIGVAIRQTKDLFAEKAHPVVKKLNGINTIILGVVALWLYGKDFLGAVGTYAIGAVILYYVILAAAPYALSFKLAHGQKSVLALGVSGRNIGAAFAVLFAAAGTDKRAITMCVIATFITLILGLVTARVLVRFAPAVGTAKEKSFKNRDLLAGRLT